MGPTLGGATSRIASARSDKGGTNARGGWPTYSHPAGAASLIAPGWGDEGGTNSRGVF